jgi:hypothetical protein
MRIFRVEYEIYNATDEGPDELVEAGGINISEDGDAEEAIGHAKKHIELSGEEDQYLVVMGVELLAEADV